MSKRIFEIEPIFVDNIPYNPLSLAQKATYTYSLDANTLFVMWARQVGKSNMLSYIFWDKIFENSTLGDTFITMSPREGDIMEFMIKDILLEAFGGKEKIYDINAIYLKPPEKWWKVQERAFKEKPALLQYWKDNDWIKYKNDNPYVKLFTEDLANTGAGKKSQSRFTGKIFTGATILCTAANDEFENTIRGKKIMGAFGDEMGQYKSDPFSALGPTIVNQGGWMLYAGTPNAKTPFNWVYDMYKEVTESPYVTYRFKYGIDFYKATVTSDIAPSFEEILANNDEHELLTEQISNTTLWSIGDLEKMFPYVYQGNKKFAQIQNERKNRLKIEYTKNSLGQYQKDNNGNIIFNLIPIPEPNPMGKFSDEQYDREFRMKFGRGNQMAFGDFSKEINVIDSLEFNPSYYNSIAGYDHGIGDAKVVGTVAGNKISAATWAKVACIPIIGTNDFQYVIYEVGYLVEADPRNIADKWYELLQEGLPIVAESVLWNETIKGGTKNFNQILNANEDLKNDYRAYTGRGIFKSKKRDWQEKAVSLNKWFREDNYKPFNRLGTVEFVHPTDSRKKGRKLFITSECKDLIDYFSKLILVANADGALTPKVMRDDIFDAATYAIDYIEFANGGKEAIQNYWLNNKKWPSKLKNQSETTILYSQMKPKELKSIGHRW